MAKRRRRKPKDPVQQVLGELLGEVKDTVIGHIKNIIMPSPPTFIPEHPIKDAEVISVRKG